MLNITELENRHKRYKGKSLIPKIVSIFLLSIISIIFISLVLFKADTTEKFIIPKQELYVKKSTVLLPVKEKVEHIKENISITAYEQPSMTITKFEAYNYLNKNTSKNEVILDSSFKLAQDNIQQKQIYTQTIQKPQETIVMPETQEEVKVIQEVKKIDNNELKITHQNTAKDIEHVLKRFENNNNPALSLFVAKKYYELGDYEKSYNYALITNDINSDIDDAWIIFTKSMVKLNRKNKAIKVLTKYINQSHSAEAKILLDDILSGKFNE